MQGVFDRLLVRTRKSNFTFIAERDGNTMIGKMDHLVCFMPGLLALGVQDFVPVKASETVEADRRAASGQSKHALKQLHMQVCHYAVRCQNLSMRLIVLSSTTWLAGGCRADANLLRVLQLYRN